MNNNDILEAAQQASANFPSCPSVNPVVRMKYHAQENCLSKPSRPIEGHGSRGAIYRKLKNGGTGASLVPNQETRICPMHEEESLESATAISGFDTTWIVENTSSKVALVAWVVKGVEVSPFEPSLSPMDDPKCLLQPGDWISVPTFESFVYHVREVDKEGPGRLVLQHRAGMIPLGAKHAKPNAASKPIDPEPISSRSLEENPPSEEAGRLGTQSRACNVVDVGFRNMASFPLAVYWAGNLVEVPDVGFACSERYSFHMGLNPAPQDFMWDWASQTKYEGSFIGHTFVARRADDPSVVVDKFTLEPTRIIDCPRKEKKLEVKASVQQEITEDVQNQEGCPNPDVTSDDDNFTEELDSRGVLENLDSASRGLAGGLSGTSGFEN